MKTTMTQFELLKYAYIGALSTYESTERAMKCKDGIYNPDMYNRLAQVRDDFETIRVRLLDETDTHKHGKI